jgi:formate dehydrogenase maturation protein FdhE
MEGIPSGFHYEETDIRQKGMLGRPGDMQCSVCGEMRRPHMMMIVPTKKLAPEGSPRKYFYDKEAFCPACWEVLSKEGKCARCGRLMKRLYSVWDKAERKSIRVCGRCEREIEGT